MKTFKIPEPTPIVDLHGEPLRDELGRIILKDGKPIVKTVAEFALDVAQDPRCTEGLQGVEAMEFLLQLRDAIRAWPTEAGADADIEDEHHRRLCVPIRGSNIYRPAIAASVLPLAYAILNAKPKPTTESE